MTKEQIYQEVNDMVIPEMFGRRQEELFAKYNEILPNIQQNTEEAEFLLDALNERYENTLRDISEKATRDFQSGEITDPQDIPLLLVEEAGESHVENIPYIVADLIILIAYVMKKYNV